MRRRDLSINLPYASLEVRACVLAVCRSVSRTPSPSNESVGARRSTRSSWRRCSCTGASGA
eukprot:360894-Chlamydomonas_euryale.AAC.6